MPSKKPTLTVRIPNDMRERLEELAQRNRRSVSNQLTVLLAEFFEEDKKGGSLSSDKKRQSITSSKAQE
jgi:predicted transcriptional regulator